MNRNEVISVLESLANGVDPATGTAIPHDLFQSPDTVRALFAASNLLKLPDGAAAEKSRKPGALTAAGTPWTEEEEALLCHEYDAGTPIGRIAVQHGRTSGAITLRLVKPARLDPATVKSRERGARLAS